MPGTIHATGGTKRDWTRLATLGIFLAVTAVAVLGFLFFPASTRIAAQICVGLILLSGSVSYFWPRRIEEGA